MITGFEPVLKEKTINTNLAQYGSFRRRIPRVGHSHTKQFYMVEANIDPLCTPHKMVRQTLFSDLELQILLKHLKPICNNPLYTGWPKKLAT